MVFKAPQGHGIGMSAETLGYRMESGQLSIDTYYLAVALEYGIIGFLVYYGFFILGTYYASRTTILKKYEQAEFRFLIPIAIALVNFLVIKSIFSQQDNHPLAFMFVGMLVGLLYRMGLKGEELGRPTA